MVGRQPNRQDPGTLQVLTPLYSHKAVPVLATVVAVADVGDRHATEHTDVHAATASVYCWAPPFTGASNVPHLHSDWLGS